MLRAALHPQDLRHAGIESLWLRLLRPLSQREIVTEGALVAAL